MTKDLISYTEKHHIDVVEAKMPLKTLKGLYSNNLIIVDKTLNQIEKNCVLAEEIGHYIYTVGDITDQKIVSNRKQEKIARNWGYERLIPLYKLISASQIGCRNRYEIAEFLNVTEEFLEDALKHYKERYGLYHKLDDYVLYFEPLGVMKIFE